MLLLLLFLLLLLLAFYKASFAVKIAKELKSARDIFWKKHNSSHNLISVTLVNY